MQAPPLLPLRALVYQRDPTTRRKVRSRDRRAWADRIVAIRSMEVLMSSPVTRDELRSAIAAGTAIVVDACPHRRTGSGTFPVP
jgi:hypothetical protein